MTGIFINYRGEDSDTAAALIERELSARLGSDRVYLDIRPIPADADFEKELLARLRACSVLVVVIGPRWLTLTDEAGRRRVDDPGDQVRREIAEALAGGLRVIPVLTGDRSIIYCKDLTLARSCSLAALKILRRSRRTLSSCSGQLTASRTPTSSLVPLTVIGV